MGIEMAKGLFITGTDTDVGKTYVGALIARELRVAGYRVGVYKPVASGCRREARELVSGDAVALWQAAGRPGELEWACPQRFEAPLAPHLAAREEGRAVDRRQLRDGLAYWRERSDIVVVEGAGGLLSPVSDADYVADLAWEFGYPLVVVARNALGTINHTLQTLAAAAVYCIDGLLDCKPNEFGCNERPPGLSVAGIVLNATETDDASAASNSAELHARCVPPLLGQVAWKADRFDREIDWFGLANCRPAGLASGGSHQGGLLAAALRQRGVG